MLEGFRHALQRMEAIEVVGCTHDGSLLLDLIDRRRPEVVALELRMRDAAGRSCLDLVAERFPEITLVVLSSSSSKEDIRSALLRGARAFIVKTVDPGDIPTVLRHACEGTVFHAVGCEPSPEEELRSAGLTEREITMLKALARGMTNRAISQELWLTEQTVKFHLGNLYRKLGVHNRLAAATFAHSHGLAA
jgi:DNA-binding NarL/FixJ family response regulator